MNYPSLIGKNKPEVGESAPKPVHSQETRPTNKAARLGRKSLLRMSISAAILIFGLIFAYTSNYCNCSRPPQDYLSIEAGSSRGARAIDWVVCRLSGKAGLEPSASVKIHSSLSSVSPATLTELSSADVPASAEKSAKLVAKFLERAVAIAKRAASLPRNKLPPANLDKTGVLSYEGDFFTLEYVLRKLLNLMSQSISPETEGRICFSNSDTNEHLQLITSAFGSISDFEQLMRSDPPNTVTKFNSNLFSYLKLYGTAHYAKCLTQVDNKFREAERQLDLEQIARFDKLVASTRYTSFKTQLDSRVAVLARNLNLEKSKLVIKKLAGAVGKNSEVVGLIPASETNYETVFNFLSIVCNNIRSAHMDSVFTVYNLARLFVPEKASELELKMPDKFMKLNEFQRICNQYRSSQSRHGVNINLRENNDKALFRRLFGFEKMAAKAEMRNKQN